MRAAAAILTLRECAPVCPSLEDIFAAVLRETRLPAEQLYGMRRDPKYCRARHIFYFAAVSLTAIKCDGVGAFLNRHRSTAHHGYQTVLKAPAKFQPELSRVLARFQTQKVAA